MKNIKFKIFFLFFAGFLQISNNFVFGMEQKEAQECSLCLASTYYVTDDEGNLINKRKEEIHENAEGLRIGSEEDIVPIDPRFKTLVDESDRSKLIPLPSSEIVKISHVDNDYKHYFHTTCFQKYIASSRSAVSNTSLLCPTCNQTIQTAITLDKVKIYPEPPQEFEIVWENQTTSGWILGYKINKIEGFTKLKTHILSLEPQRTVSQLSLDIYDGIHTIPENFFSGLETLEIQTLWLDNNNLTSLPTSIGELTSLKGLFLWNNKLTSLPTSIGNLTSLERLDFWNNKLTSLPESIGNLRSLERLDLRFNRLTSLPTSIGDLINLKFLNINLNRLASLPESIGQLTNLKWLSLSRNQLTSLPIEIENLTSLKKLYLDLNYLIPWPTQILQPLLDKTPQTRIYGEGLQTNNVVPINENIRENRLFLKYKIKRVEGLIPFKNFLLRLQRDTQAKISELNLRIDGNIHTIPEDFFSGLEIEKLWLCNNKLTSLPTSIGSLSNLKELDLYGNSLTSLPESIGNLRSLETLNLDFNKLTSLPTSIGQLGNLKFLWIHFNHLVPWPTETLQHLFSGIDLIVNKYTQTLTKRQIQDWLKRKTRRRRRRYQQIGHHQL